MKSSKQNISIIIKILEKHFNYSERTTLNKMRKEKQDAFKILIACLLSLRAKDETTEKISKNLFKIADTPEEILKIPNNKLKKIIYSTGHYNKKALALKSVSEELIKNIIPKSHVQNKNFYQ